MNIEEFREKRGWSVTLLCKKAGISRTTYYKFKDECAEVTCSKGKFIIEQRVERARGDL
jgi:ACT domain-containing protein